MAFSSKIGGFYMTIPRPEHLLANQQEHEVKNKINKSSLTVLLQDFPINFHKLLNTCQRHHGHANIEVSTAINC
jgi:hypothetical protein